MLCLLSRFSIFAVLWILTFFCFLLSPQVSAMERDPDLLRVCLKYRNVDKTFKKGERKEAVWSSGGKMNESRANGNFNPNKYYIMVMWKYGAGFSLFEVDSPQDKPTSIAKNYTDQVGVTWSIQTGWSKCR